MTSETNKTTGIRVETTISPITLDKLSTTEFQKKGTITAQIRQTVSLKSFYPSAKVASSMQENLFAIDEFAGITEQSFDSVENRVAFIPVPEDSTEDAVIGKLAAVNANKASIYKVLSNKPIVDENQSRAIEANLNGFTLDKVANSQIVRYPKDTIKDSINVGGQIVLDNLGKPQYRRTYFWATPKADMDLRTADPNEFYITPEIKAELLGASVMQGQTI